MENSNNKGVKVVGFWFSIFTHRVRWALRLKGIEYEYIEEDIYNKSHLLSKLNPIYEKVPVLIHDGISMPESSIIVEYIDQMWSHNPLMPQDPYKRAEARFWAKFADEKVMISTWLVLCSVGDNQKRAIKLSIENLKIVEEKLKGRRFFGGDTIGYLDLMMGYVAYILPVWEEVASVRILDPLKFPAIAAWSENFLSHPVIKTAYLPPKVEMLTYFRWRRNELLPVYASPEKRIWSYVTE